MPETVYAAFADVGNAEGAAGALLDRGVAAKDISLVVNEEAKKRIEGSAAAESHPPATGGTVSAVEVDEDLNPAQNDYPRTGSDSPTELSSRPPNSKYDWNPDLDKNSYNAGYERATSEAVDDEIRLEGDRDRARVDPASVNKENDPGTVSNAAPVDPVPDVAHGGVETKTIQSAATGAAKGVGMGLGMGAIAAVAAIAIPGFGLILGGGALAAAVAGLAATSGAGAVAGGVVGYLKEQGVPADQIPEFQKAYEGGGAILGIVLEDGADRAKVEGVLREHGASNVRRVPAAT